MQQAAEITDQGSRDEGSGATARSRSQYWRLLSRFASLGVRDASSELSALTNRELDVLLEVARGGSNADIARSLGLAELTVKSHLYHVMQKLHLSSRTQLVITAYETGLVSPGQVNGPEAPV